MLAKWLSKFKKEEYYFNYIFFQRALVAALAVFIAVLITLKISFSKECLIVLAAFLASQITIGATFKQGLIFSGILLLAILFGAAVKFLDDRIIIYSITALIFILTSYYAIINRFQINRNYFQLVIFALLFSLIILSSENINGSIRNRVLDVLIGSSVGILCAQIIFPIKIEQIFKQGMLLLVENLSNYASVLVDGFVTNQVSQKELLQKKSDLYQVLQQNYLEWIYDIGFNPGLRAGMRFFSLKLEEVTDIFFSLTYFSNISIDKTLFKELNQAIGQALSKNRELLQILVKFFANKNISDVKSDFTSDIVVLEDTLQRVIPDNIDLINLSPDYVVVTALVRDIKDMRIAILALVQALPIDTH